MSLRSIFFGVKKVVSDGVSNSVTGKVVNESVVNAGNAIKGISESASGKISEVTSTVSSVVSNTATTTAVNAGKSIMSKTISTTSSIQKTIRIFKYSLVLLSGGVFLFGLSKAVESISKMNKD